MIKPYAFAASIATIGALLAAGSDCGRCGRGGSCEMGTGGDSTIIDPACPGDGPDAAGAGGCGGDVSAPSIICDCASPHLWPSCEPLCVPPYSCASPCAVCVSENGQRSEPVCNGVPSAIVIYFTVDGEEHVCDGESVEHCESGTNCEAVATGGHLVGKCL